jgi:hypothetical protein
MILFSWLIKRRGNLSVRKESGHTGPQHVVLLTIITQCQQATQHAHLCMLNSLYGDQFNFHRVRSEDPPNSARSRGALHLCQFYTRTSPIRTLSKNLEDSNTVACSVLRHVHHPPAPRISLLILTPREEPSEPSDKTTKPTTEITTVHINPLVCSRSDELFAWSWAPNPILNSSCKPPPPALLPTRYIVHMRSTHKSHG